MGQRRSHNVNRIILWNEENKNTSNLGNAKEQN